MKVKNILSKVGSWVFVGITMLGLLCIYVGFGGSGRYRFHSISTDYYFIIIGVVLIIPSLILLWKANIIDNKLKNAEYQRIVDLVASGERLIIKLDELEIQSNSYLQEIEVGNGYRKRNEQIEINHNVVFLKIPYKDDIIHYRLNIFMDITTLKMHFAIKKETEFYIDPENPGNHYLDLTFLDE